MYHDGKHIWYSGFRSWTAANKRKHEIETQQDFGIFIQPGKVSLNEYLAAWLRDYVTPNLSPRTLEGYQDLIRKHINPALGTILLTRLTPGALQTFYATMTPQTAVHCHRCLSAALTIAVKQGLLVRNPCKAVTAPTIQKREMHVLDEDGVHQFLEASKSTKYYVLFYLALYTGMRRSEILAQRWTDIDLDAGMLSVNRSLHHVKEGFIYRQPKTSKSRRLIALTPSTIAVLATHKARQMAQHLLQGVPLPADALVFCQPDGTPLLPGTVSHAWEDVARRLGLNVRLHDARHSHASILLKHGIHPKIVSERLGHSSILITLDTYSHVLPGIQAAAAKKFDEALK